LSHDVARYFGDSDRSRHHKEVAFFEDMRVLVEDMILKGIHVVKAGRFIPGPSKKEGGTKIVQSAIFDIMVASAEVWHNSKFNEYTLGYPITEQTTPDKVQHRLQTDTVFDDVMVNPLEYDSLEDLDDEAVSSSYPGLDGFGGTDGF